jgi:hypothetical protein
VIGTLRVHSLFLCDMNTVKNVGSVLNLYLSEPDTLKFRLPLLCWDRGLLGSNILALDSFNFTDMILDAEDIDSRFVPGRDDVDITL